MSIIGSRRFQQGVFEALASQNRAYGSGGGSGLGLREIANATIGTVGGITATGSPTVITGSSITFPSPPGVNTLLVVGALNAGSNCAAGLFNLVALNGSGGLTPQGGVWPYAMLLGIGAGTINYLPFSLLAIASTVPGLQSVDWQVNASTNGSVTVNNGYLVVFALS